jgi:hypothetical protein
MKKIVLGCFAVAASATLYACSSSDACSTFYSAQATQTANAAPCAGDAGAPPPDGGTQATCEAILNGGACTSSDKTALETAATAFQTCITAAGVCAPATASTWATNLSTCETPIELSIIGGDAGISAACTTAALGPGGL